MIYALAMTKDDWKVFNSEMLAKIDKWEHYLAEADKTENESDVAYRWDDANLDHITKMENSIREHDLEADYFLVGDEALEYGIERHYGLESCLLNVEKPMLVLGNKELYLLEAERIIRAMAKELHPDKVKEIFEQECFKRENGIQPVIDNYIGNINE